MKKLTNAVDRFCYRHPRFGIPNLMLYIVIANVIIWVFNLVDTRGILLSALSFSPWHILHGQVWRLFTFVLMPYQTGFLALISFYFFYFIGSTVEREWGAGRFTIYLLGGALLTAIYGFVLYFVESAGAEAAYRQAISGNIGYFVNAYYIYLSLFFAFATLFPETRVLLFFVIPIKIKWLGLLDAALFLYDIVRITPVAYKFLPIVAILNYLLFCGDWLIDLVRPRRMRQRSNVVNFRKEVRRMSREQASRPWTRRCEVCGRTDTEYPDLEFRYCSRCSGYHCFCIDHINNHRHFTE